MQSAGQYIRSLIQYDILIFFMYVVLKFALCLTLGLSNTTGLCPLPVKETS